MNQINSATKMIESTIDIPLSNPYIMAILKIALTLFASVIAPRPPQMLQNVFKNTFVKIALISLIVYISEKDLQLALLISIIFVLGNNILSGRNILESFQSFTGKEFADFSKDAKIVNKMKLLESKTDIYPGCENITMNDLQKIFDGDTTKFSRAVNQSFKELVSKIKDKNSRNKIMAIGRYVGLPANLNFDYPETAPYLATLLVNYGYNLNEKCQPPIN
jgi:small basic protein